MKALIVSLESFQKGDVPQEVQEYINGCKIEPFIILDESSKIKTNNPCKDSKKSKRTQAILKLNRVGQRCILTGTFMSKSPVNAYDQMCFLKENFFTESMFSFAERYEVRRSLPNVRGARITIPQKDWLTIRKRLLAVKNKPMALSYCIESIHSFYGISKEDCEYIMQNAEYSPFKNIDELWSRIGDTCLKVTREELFDLPPKVFKTFNIALTKAQKKLYMQLQNQHCTDNLVVENGLSLYLRFQDICNGYEPVDLGDTVDESGNIKHNVELRPLEENPKLDALEEIIDEIGDKQVVVWCSRSQLLHDAKERLSKLGYSVGVYDGKVKQEDRLKDYEDFSNKKIQIIFINQASGAYGLDGLKDCDYAIYLCNSYSVEQREQSVDRIYRGKVTRSKYIIDIMCSGTCEERVTEALKQGKELLTTGTTDVEVFKYFGEK